MLVEVVSVPAGEAPEEIRRAWVGVRFHVVHLPNGSQGARGVVTKERVAPYSCYSVPFLVALEALGWKDVKAAQWWASLARRPDALLFREEECRVVEN